MSKKLIVFYTYTQNTKKVAEELQKTLGCDILELKPVVSFSNDYQTVVDEWQNNSIKDEVEIQDINVNLADYDTIILGSPIWWYTITPVVTTFLKKYDLSGKTIYPFVTSAGWFGHSIVDIKKLCPNSKIEKDLKVTFAEDYNSHRIVSNKNDITAWANSIK